MNQRTLEMARKYMEQLQISEWQVFPQDMARFAELIVRECMDVVRDINQEYDGGSTVVNAAEEIAEYFGVEG